MGILRTDRVTGLGGANAITGSVNFTNDGATSTGDYLRVDRKDNSDFNLSTNDFTIEFWMYSRNVGASLHLVTFAASTVSASSDAGFYVRQYGGVVQGYLFEGNNSIGAVATGTISTDRWYHIAYVRSGSTFTMYLDGTSTATATSSEAANFDSSWNLNIGSAYTNVYHYNGYLSNLRIINGTALYTSNFTPNTRLTNVANTVLLACQSSGNVLQEGTNKNIHLVQASSDNAGPVASRFTPNSPVGFSTTTDVGTQFGTTFDGVTTFDSQAYFVPSGGNTRERNRGRALLGGGHDNSSATNHIHQLSIQSQGNTEEFGDLTVARWIPAAVSSSTRGVWCGGGGPYVNTIDFVTIANSANATDFGDLLEKKSYFDAVSNETRGVVGGGYNDPGGSRINVLEFITIATAGNAQDFGDLTVVRMQVKGAASPTRGLFMGGDLAPNSVPTNVVDFITIASAGNAQDFGDMTAPTKYGGATSSNVRAIYAGGNSPDDSTFSNKIEFFTIATLGNGTDFGDLITARQTSPGTTSNNTRGVIAGGYVPSGNLNSIEFITIASTGNAQDFGDIILHNRRGIGACSDSHGGLE